MFTYELQSLLENDDYIKTTYDKFYEILKVEKSNFENFMHQLKTEMQAHKKAGNDYITEVKAYYQSCESIF